MFTGIIEETGKILSITDKIVVIEADIVLKNTKIGDSIAVNGVCLTVTDLSNCSFCADVSPETFRVSALKELKKGSIVNLERAMAADGRFGGHIVSGHVDSIARIIAIEKNTEFYNLKISLNSDSSRYVVKKGSITIDGISLTVANIANNIVTIAIIPHTFENTNLKTHQKDDLVNIEVDILAKYIEKFLSTSDNRSRIDMDFLQRNGFC